MTPALQACGLVKRRGSFALGPLDFDLEYGLVTALIGPNGAGKTTLLDLLAGLRAPDSGELHLHGERVTPAAPRWKAALGYVSEDQPFFEHWTGARNLAFFRAHFPTFSDALATDLAGRLDLPLRQPVRTLSKGNRLKLAIVAALAHRPTVLLLDEPTSGLDPVARGELQSVLWEQLQDVTPTMLYSTHILSDVSRLADRFLFLRGGQLVLDTDRDALTEPWLRLSARTNAPTPTLQALPGVVEVQRDSHGNISILSRDHAVTRRALEALGAAVHGAAPPALDEIAVHVLKSPAATGDTHVAVDSR